MAEITPMAKETLITPARGQGTAQLIITEDLLQRVKELQVQIFTVKPQEKVQHGLQIIKEIPEALLHEITTEVL
jgi:hypothetical protein